MQVLFDRIHKNYLSKVSQERSRIRDEKWSVDKMEGYVEGYFDNNLFNLRSLFNLESPLVEACIEESAYQKIKF